LAKELRQIGLNTEIYPDTATRLDKQLKYANKKQIPFVIILGPKEIEKKVITLKNMKTGQQTTDSFEKIAKMVV
jgi:histidyl-tRNA synthetase